MLYNINITLIEYVFSSQHQCPSSTVEGDTHRTTHDIVDPVTTISRLLKSVITDNIENTKVDFRMLSETHDEAKSLIDRMSENYRQLQVK